MTADLFFFYLALVGYLVGTLHYLLHLVSRRLVIGTVATAATMAGFAAHTLSQVLHVYRMGRPSFAGPYETLSFFAWATVLIYLIIEFRYRNRIMGAFALPIVVLACSAAAALPRRIAELAPAAFHGLGLWVHVTLAIFGNAAFALTFCTGLMYILQERQLKSRHPGTIHFRLPPLELLDDVGVKSLLFGFPLLTLALITGSIGAELARGSFLSLRVRETWSIASWLIFAGLVYARLSAGWRGRKAAILAIIGFCLVLSTLIGVSLFRGRLIL
jgi:cytochrome c-type biogenesis protein CcsB